MLRLHDDEFISRPSAGRGAKHRAAATPTFLARDSSKSPLALDQILEKCFVERDARVHRNVVNMGFGAFVPKVIAEFFN
jgi:hypothetical protein